MFEREEFINTAFKTFHSVVLPKIRNSDVKDYAHAVVDFFEMLRENGINAMIIEPIQTRKELQEATAESYEFVAKEYLNQAFKAIYTEDLSKEEIKESFLNGLKYSDRLGMNDTRLVKLARKILPYYRD